MNSQSNSSPLAVEKMMPKIRGLYSTGQPMVDKASDAINTITCIRAMQIGYIEACKDHGLSPPEFTDPAEYVAGGVFRA